MSFVPREPATCERYMSNRQKLKSFLYQLNQHMEIPTVSKGRELSMLNDPHSDVYREVLSRTQMHIRPRLQNWPKMRCLHDKTGLTSEDGAAGLVGHLGDSTATNLVKQFFKGEFAKIKNCDLCGRRFDRGLNRSHCNREGGGRLNLLRRAVDHFYVDCDTPVETGKVLRKFIEFHMEQPLYMLCTKCHGKYDKGR